METWTEARIRQRDVPLVISYGGGVDSTGTLCRLHEIGLRPDAIVFADTGGEKPDTYAFLDLMDSWLALRDFPTVTRVKYQPRTSTYRTLEEECLQKATLPSRVFGFGRCSEKWKVRAQAQWLRKWEPAVTARKAKKNIVRAISFEADETRRMKGIEDAGVEYWYPLIEWGWYREDCVEAIERNGLPVPPKSACFFCPSSTKTDIIQLGRKFPALLERALAMEDAARPGLDTVKGLGRRFSWREFVEADSAKQKAFPEAPVEACVTCMDDSDSCRL